MPADAAEEQRLRLLSPTCGGCLQVSACEKAGDTDQALRLLDRLHSHRGQAPQELYARMLTRLGAELRWGQALELFLELQLAGGQTSRLQVFDWWGRCCDGR